VVLGRYARYYDVYEKVVAVNDIDSAELRDVAAGLAFRTIINLMIKNRADGVVVRGAVIRDPRAVRISGGTAVIDDCQDSSNARVYSVDTQQPEYPPVSQPKMLVRTTMNVLDRRWVVTRQQLVSRCS